METWRALGDQMTSSFSKEWGFKEVFFFLIDLFKKLFGHDIGFTNYLFPTDGKIERAVVIFSRELFC